MKKTNKTKTFKLRPLADRVVITPIVETHTQTKAGIYIPDTISKERPEMGLVVAVGPGKLEDGKLRPLSVKVGDTILFTKYGYEEVKLDGVEYYILKEDGILAVLNK